MEAITHKWCYWCLDGLLMGEEQRQEPVRTPGADSKKNLYSPGLRAFRCQTPPRLSRVVTSGGIRGVSEAGYQ